MNITIYTKDPEGFKKQIIKDVENGELPTWELRTNDVGDKLLTHSAEQWVDKVLLRLSPNTDAHKLVVEPRYWSKMEKPSDEEFGTIMGRFCERLFVQYSSVIDSFSANVSR